MKNSNNVLTIIALVLLMVSCKPTSETYTSKIDVSNIKSETGIIYALPRTNLLFTVEATKTEVIPGPYCEYAEKYMGLDNVPEKESTVWSFNDIKIDSYNDIDPEQYYIIEPSGKMRIDLSKLIKNGNVIPVNRAVETEFPNEFYGENTSDNGIVFTDLSVTKYVGQEKVTYYKRVQRDSLFAKVPVTKTQSVYRSFEDKAEEAANFIFMIREKRFELLAGMADFYPEGKALEATIEELNRLEEEYLALFTGKRFTSSYSASFEFVPTKKELEQPYILFRFNEEKGILPPNDLRGRPIIIELEVKEQTNNLSYLLADQVNREGLSYKNKLFYRIPELTRVKVYDGNNLLAIRKSYIEQFGVVVSVPSMFLTGEEKFIEFYPEK